MFSGFFRKSEDSEFSKAAREFKENKTIREKVKNNPEVMERAGNPTELQLARDGEEENCTFVTDTGKTIVVNRSTGDTDVRDT
jgi:hypothetical protein